MIDPGTIGGIISGASAVGGAISSLFGGGGGSRDSGGGGGSFGMGGDSAGSESLLWGLRETRNAVARAMEAYNNALTNARKELQPYREAGGQGINALSAALTPEGGMSQTDMVSGLPPGAGADLMNYLTQTPAYQFPLQEGINALDRSAASKGMLLSGAQQKGINQYGQNFALSNALAPAMANYQAYLKNIAGLSGIGQTAATTTGGYDIRTGELIGGSQLAMAQMQNALAGGIATNAMGQQRMDYMRSLSEPNIGSTLGTIAGLPWGQIGNSLSGLFSGGANTAGILSSYSPTVQSMSGGGASPSGIIGNWGW